MVDGPSMDTETSTPSPSSHGVTRGVDVSVTAHLGDLTVTGEVTLIRCGSDDRWDSWGSRDHWCSQEFLDMADEHPELPVLDDVLAAAQMAIADDSDIEERVAAAVLDAVLAAQHDAD